MLKQAQTRKQGRPGEGVSVLSPRPEPEPAGEGGGGTALADKPAAPPVWDREEGQPGQATNPIPTPLEFHSGPGRASFHSLPAEKGFRGQVGFPSPDTRPSHLSVLWV